MSRTVLVTGIVAILVVCPFVQIADAEPIEVDSRVSSVTVYRGQALVSRTMTVKVPSGSSEILVSDLPSAIVGESLFAVGGDGIEVRAVRYRTHVVKEEPDKELRKILDEIEELVAVLAANTAEQEAVAKASGYIAGLSTFVTSTAKVDLSKGLLDAKALTELSLFVMDQQRLKATEAVALRTTRHGLEKQQRLLERKRAELAGVSPPTRRQAIVFLWADKAASAGVTLSYIVTRAGWHPSYTVGSSDESDIVTVEYSAAIHQTSGEDWRDVEVTLSTASPSLTAESPELAPFWVTLRDSPLLNAANEQAVASQMKMIASRRASKGFARQQAVRQDQRQKATWDMNVLSNEEQLIEAISPRAGLREKRGGRRREGMSVTYKLPGHASLDSRADTQLVRIGELELEGDFYYVATPLLTSFVYRQAELANESPLALLEGPAEVYRNGGFVGKSSVPMVAQGQKFVMGFGSEPQLRTSRERIARKEAEMGANRVVDIKYRLLVENFMDKNVDVRLYDRLPYPSGKADIRVTPGEMTDELSTDSLYLETERSKGILRWDIDVPARSANSDARKVEYSFKMEFDRNLHLATPAGDDGSEARELQAEFQNLRLLRSRAR